MNSMLDVMLSALGTQPRKIPIWDGRVPVSPKERGLSCKHLLEADFWVLFFLWDNT